MIREKTAQQREALGRRPATIVVSVDAGENAVQAQRVLDNVASLQPRQSDIPDLTCLCDPQGRLIHNASCVVAMPAASLQVRLSARWIRWEADERRHPSLQLSELFGHARNTVQELVQLWQININVAGAIGLAKLRPLHSLSLNARMDCSAVFLEPPIPVCAGPRLF
ncbi:MAG: hypothetical protein U1E73_03005 [Planctomycetota bacterium]